MARGRADGLEPSRDHSRGGYFPDLPLHFGLASPPAAELYSSLAARVPADAEIGAVSRRSQSYLLWSSPSLPILIDERIRNHLGAQ